jgi:hypothetical protein
MKKLALTIGGLVLPLVSFAQSDPDLSNVNTLVTSIGEIINLVVPILFTLALVGFFYGLVMYIFGKEDDKAQAKKTMIWGVVALFVMASVWGLVAFLSTAVGVETGGGPGFQVGDLVPQP